MGGTGHTGWGAGGEAATLTRKDPPRVAPQHAMDRAYELIMFAGREHAVRAGWKGPTQAHPLDPKLRAWWPALDRDPLRGYEYSRITVTGALLRITYERGTAREQALLEACLTEARAHLRVEPRIWMEL